MSQFLTRTSHALVNTSLKFNASQLHSYMGLTLIYFGVACTLFGVNLYDSTFIERESRCRVFNDLICVLILLTCWDRTQNSAWHFFTRRFGLRFCLRSWWRLFWWQRACLHLTRRGARCVRVCVLVLFVCSV